jgi:outer membrane receptor protein involved in Fe transport
VLQASGGPFVEARVRWSDRLRTTGGLRLDGWWADVESDVAQGSGRETALLLSPKLGVVLGPWRGSELYLDAGYGFHSNDARGATLRVDPRTGEPAARVDPLVRARAVDLGLRSERGGVHGSLALFLLDFDSELLFVGDAGGTEATRPSRRVGVELATAWQPRSWLRLEADASLARARFRDGDPAGDRIPGAVERVGSAAVLFGERGAGDLDDGEGAVGPGPAALAWRRLSGGLRLRHLGPRALREDGAVRAGTSTLVYAEAGYRLAAGLRVGLEVYNLLDAEAQDIEYWYESRPTRDGAASEDVHLHPAEPRSLRLVLSWRG